MISHTLSISTTRRLMLAITFISSMASMAAPAPRLVIDEQVFDFGEQHNNQTIEHTFVIRNEGEMTLLINDIRSSCGCTVGNVTSREIEPGQISKITAAFNLRGRQGTQHSVLTLETNDPIQPRVQLAMRGVAAQDMQVRPTSLFFGQLYQGHSSSRVVEIVGLPHQPFEIVNATASIEGVAIIVETVEPHFYRLRVDLDGTHKTGMVQGDIRVATSHLKFPQLHIPIAAQIVGALTVAPDSIKLVAGVETPVTRYVVVRPGAIQEFKITHVTAPSNDIGVNLLQMPGQGYRIQLTNLRATPDLNGKSLRIQTDLEQNALIEVPFEIIQP